MRYHTRSFTWQGQPFRFQRLHLTPAGEALWAVSRRGEFIGTMPCSAEITTKDFDVRSLLWLGELLGGSVGRLPIP